MGILFGPHRIRREPVWKGQSRPSSRARAKATSTRGRSGSCRTCPMSILAGPSLTSATATDQNRFQAVAMATITSQGIAAADQSHCPPAAMTPTSHHQVDQATKLPKNPFPWKHPLGANIILDLTKMMTMLAVRTKMI